MTTAIRTFFLFGILIQSLAFADPLSQRVYGNDLAAPSAESLVGKYLAETGASWTLRSFPNAPEGNLVPLYKLGPKKLVISISTKTIHAFLKYFSSYHFLFHLHTPEQGTIYNIFEGKYGSYAQLNDDLSSLDPNNISNGTLFIPVLLSSSEGARTRNYFKLASAMNGYALTPNALKDNRDLPYCASNAFRGCTHWFGDMPIGNQLVSTYVFPSGDPNGKAPASKPLTPYELPQQYTPELKKLIHSVWTIPGHQQLGQIIAPKSHLRGELANPGWAAYTLLGTVKTDRVPLVFWFQDDVKKKIPKNFPLQIYAH